MADPNAPWLADTIVTQAPATQAQAPTPTNQPVTDPNTPWSADPVVAPTNAPAAAPTPQTQAQVNDHFLAMINDPKVTGQQLRAFYTQQGGKLSEHDSDLIDQRDTFIAHNHRTPAIGIDAAHPAESTSPGLTDNRPYSFQEGVRQGSQQVLSNVAGGSGWLANKVGINNQWGDNTRHYFANMEAAMPEQGSSLGKVAGEVITAAPAALATIPVEGGAAAVGAPLWAARSLAMLADGGAQGALTTHSNTLGGVVRDAATGAIVGAGLGTAAHGLSTLASTPTAAAIKGREVLNAADRIGVRPLPADVGGPLTKGLNAVGDAGLLSNLPLSAGAENYLARVQGVRDRVAADLLPAGGNGAVRDINSAALHVLHSAGGLGDYEARSAAAGGKLYDDAAQLAGSTHIETPRTLAAVNALIDRAEQTPGNSPGLDALRSLRDDLSPEPDQIVNSGLLDQHGNPITHVVAGQRAQYAIDNLRRLRTSFGDNFDSSQRAAREAANTLWGPLSEDIQHGLNDAGRPEAADAYRAADQNWAQRQQHLDETVNPILGNRSHELLADKLVDMTRNDHDLLNRGLDLMSPDQGAHVKAALVANLGRSNPGAQNATGTAFSLHNFGTDWDKLSPNLKTTMLSGDAGDKLQDLARIAEAAKASGRYKNTSGTARSLDALNLLRTGVSGLVLGGGEAAGGALTAGASLAAQYGLGRALASPALARGLVRMGEVRPIARSAGALAAVGRRVAPAADNQ